MEFLDLENVASILRSSAPSVPGATGRIQELQVTYVPLNIGRARLSSESRLVALLAELYAALENVHTLSIPCHGASYALGALAILHTTSSQYPLPRLRTLRICSGPRSRIRNKYPAVEDLVGWLRPRIEAGFGPSTLLLDYLPGQERPAFVDHRLLALVPEARYLDREDPIPE